MKNINYKTFIIPIFSYIVFMMIYSLLRKNFNSSYEETGNIIYLLLLMVTAYIFYSIYYTVF